MRPTSIDPEALLAHDGLVRALAREILREESQVDDVVQETWIATLRADLRSVASLRGWLAAVVRNLARDARRTTDHRREREEIAARAERVPPIDTILEREEARRAVVLALAKLPPLYRDVLLLRYFEDLSPPAIASRLEIPLETVRTRLKRGLAQLRVSIALPSQPRLRDTLLAVAYPSESTLTGGAAIMASSKKVLIAVATISLLCLGVGYIVASRDALPTESVPESATAPPTQTTPAASSAPREPSRALERPVTKVTEVEPLVITVLWESDRRPAADVSVHVRPWDVSNSHLRKRTVRTNHAGQAEVAGLPEGKTLLYGDRGGHAQVNVAAGVRAEATLVIPSGIDVEGVVVDDAERPVANALLRVSQFANFDEWADAGRSDSEGKFWLRSITPNHHISASAPDPTMRPSPIYAVSADRGNPMSLRLQVRRRAAALSGRVVVSDGAPVAGAFITVGARRITWLHSLPGDPVALSAPCQIVSDSDGKFELFGLDPVTTDITVRADGYAGYHGDVTLSSQEPAILIIELQRGFTLEGTVRDSSGAPVASAEVLALPAWISPGVDPSSGQISPGEAGLTAQTDSEGRYRLDGVDPGRVLVQASKGHHIQFGCITGLAGERREWNPKLGEKLPMRGRVVDGAGNPLEGFVVSLTPDFGKPRAQIVVESAKTDAQGKFEIANCGAERYWLSVYCGVSKAMSGTKELANVAPGGEEILVVVENAVARTCNVEGTLLSVNGAPALDVGVQLFRNGEIVLPSGRTDSATGRFHLGPFAPGLLEVRFGLHDHFSLAQSKWVAAHETWDLGTLRMRAEGTLQCRVVVDQPAGPQERSYAFIEARPVGVDGTVPINCAHRIQLDQQMGGSAQLPAGRYKLTMRSVHPPAIAAEPIVEISESGTTTLTIPARRGVPVSLSSRLEDGDDPGRVQFTIHDEAGALVTQGISSSGAWSSAWQTVLAVGRYGVTASAGSKRARWTLEVAHPRQRIITATLVLR
ncbi:MAG: sigma-70 family RNA polymerase sigma factor [Planctomycetes bacterium]|nr:sigma-70 family RNA polymerase sigma factor [Planctomycetota bacterium]